MSKKTFVLRPHALLSSPTSTRNFGSDNEVVIPLSVLDEIRQEKKQSLEKKKIAKIILEYINSFNTEELMSKEGVVQENGSRLRVSDDYEQINVKLNGITKAEYRTLQICLGLITEGKEVILVTNNMTLQLRAKNLKIKAENFKDTIFPRLKDQYTGRNEIYIGDTAMAQFYEDGYIQLSKAILHYSAETQEFAENQFLIIRSSQGNSALGIYQNEMIKKLNYQNVYPYDARAKNVGQKFMLEALLDDQFPLVVIKGGAGTGKTFCALAAGLQGVETEKKYSRILVTRSVTATEEYGFLPGDIEEKLAPYLAGVKDNLSILLHGPKNNRFERYEDGTFFFEKGIVQIQAIGFLRGRSIVDTYFIIDETQNIDPDLIKSIVTRAGQGSKFVFLGDPTQIDNPNLTERYNGLVYLSEKMKGNPLCAQVSLTDNESVRSILAKEAAKVL